MGHGLKIDRDRAFSFIEDNLPTYPQFETWILEPRSGKFPASEIEASNAAIRGVQPRGRDAR